MLVTHMKTNVFFVCLFVLNLIPDQIDEFKCIMQSEKLLVTKVIK